MTTGWVRLGDAIKSRREELRLPQNLDGRGPGEITVRRLERAEATAVRNGTKSQLEDALQWRRGAVDELLAGTATPDEITGPDVGPRSDAVEDGYMDAVSAFELHKGGTVLGDIAERFGVSKSTAMRMVREGGYLVAMTS